MNGEIEAKDIIESSIRNYLLDNYGLALAQIQNIIDKFGTIDILVNNAAIEITSDFEDKTKISTIGQAKYLPIYGQNPGLYTKNDGTFSLQQGMVEMSNANTINEMLNSINVSRGYEAMSKLLKNQSDTVQQAISLGNISR